MKTLGFGLDAKIRKAFSRKLAKFFEFFACICADIENLCVVKITALVLQKL